MTTPDQHLIDEFFRNLKGTEQNGHGPNGHTPSVLSDDRIVERCRKAQNAAKFASLFDDGDLSAYGGDDSAADFGLLGIFKFYTQDPDQLERLMYRSALRRPKWGESRGGMSWLRYSISNSLRTGSETYQNGKTTPHTCEDQAVQDVNSFSRNRNEVAGERIADLFKTAKQCAEETPAQPNWYVDGFVVEGGITKLDGKIKTSGKTTLITHMVADVVYGRPFMGFPTKKTKVLILTEQAPASFRQSLRRAGLEETEDVEVLYWRDVIDVPWPSVVAAATDRAQQIGAGMLIADTVGQFAAIQGDGENSAGEAQNAMRPLQEAAAKGLAVVATYHERKSGGDVGDSGRGSTAFGGAVDIILSLKRGDGNTRESVRILEGIGRYDETPNKLVIELVDGRYRALGDTTQFAEQEAMKAIVELLPMKAEHALSTSEVHDKVKAVAALGKTVIDTALEKLTNVGTIKRTGKGAKGSPYRYYKPGPEEDPEPHLPRGDSEAGDIHSPGTPHYTREKEIRNLNDEKNKPTERVRKAPPRLTEEQTRQVQQLIKEGVSPRFAQAEVLGEDNEGG